MTVISLKIDWYDAHEHLSIDFEDLPKAGELCESWEFWPASKSWGAYNARFISAEKDGQSWTILFDYLEPDNADLVDSEPRFGRSTVMIDLETGTASAHWKDAADTEVETSPYSNEAKACKILNDSEALTTLRDRETLTRISRANATKLRNQLIALDHGQERCAISGAAISQVLDVAHIIEVRDLGSDSPRNCMLLRADLHRLFDQRLLTFSADGKVELAPECRSFYEQELGSKCLSNDVFKRVGAALKLRPKGSHDATPHSTPLAVAAFK